MRKFIDFSLRHAVGIIGLLFVTLIAYAQFTPPAVGAYIFSGGLWTPATTSTTAGGVTYTPPPEALYCFNTTTKQWVPADSNCFGSGGGGGGDTITSPGSTLNVGGSSFATTLDLNLASANTWTVNQTINSAQLTGDSLTLINTNSSNLAGINFQSAGGKTFKIFDGGTVAANNLFGVYDATDSAYVAVFGVNEFNVPTTGVIGWGSLPTTTPIAGISSPSSATFDFGNGTANDTSGGIHAAHLFAGANEATVTAASTANAAMCLKSAGPPVVLGVCSSVVAAGGTCTCN